ncbi:unnamed protein product [Prunus brigantina]
MASAATDLLSGKVVGILESKASSIVGVRDQVDEIKQELISMKPFLKDAEEGGGGGGLDLQACSAKPFAFQNIGTEVDLQGGSTKPDTTQSIFGIGINLQAGSTKPFTFQSIWVNLQAASTKPFTFQRNFGIGIKLAKRTSSDDIQKWVKNQAVSSLFIKEDELVGIEDKKQILMGWLMNGEQQQTVISVVGMGGSGKITLVAKTFTSESVN